MLVYNVSQRISARVLKCSKQILSRELSPIVCSTSVSSHGWKAFREFHPWEETEVEHTIGLNSRESVCLEPFNTRALIRWLTLRIYFFFPLWPRPHVIGFVADIFFSTLESGFIFFRIRCRIRRIRVDGSRIGKKKLRIRKYPDASGRGLNEWCECLFGPVALIC